MPDGTSLPRKPCRMVKGPTGYGCYLLESSTRTGPWPWLRTIRHLLGQGPPIGSYYLQVKLAWEYNREAVLKVQWSITWQPPPPFSTALFSSPHSFHTGSAVMVKIVLGVWMVSVGFVEFYIISLFLMVLAHECNSFTSCTLDSNEEGKTPQLETPQVFF